LLKKQSFDRISLSIWDEQLIKQGLKIHKKREEFFKELNPIFQHYFEFISGGRESVNLKYESQLYEGEFTDMLEQSLQKDRIMKYTTCGIHKDDLKFNIDSYPIKKFGSQGQQKSFLIAIKLAQFEYTKKLKKFKPVLLFDDIFDKLDDTRVEAIINLVSENNFGQIFITDTQRQRVEKIFREVSIDHNIFAVENGMVKHTDD